MLESKVSVQYWPEAVATTNYLLNRLPTKILKYQTHLDLLAQFHPIPTYLTLSPCIFGCTVYVHIPRAHRSKLDPCATKCVFVGNGVNQKGYRCFDPQTHRVYTTMECNFLETKYFFHNHPRSQGKHTQIDSLGWLHTPILPEAVPTGGIDQTTGPTSNNVAESSTPDHNLVSTSNESPVVSQPGKTPSSPEKQFLEISNPVQEHPKFIEIGYTLPPRKNRGIHQSDISQNTDQRIQAIR